MITDGPLTEPAAADDSGRAATAPGERVRRFQRRRRLLREEMLAITFLVALLAATVVVLATQWLESGPSANASGVAVVQTIYRGGTT